MKTIINILKKIDSLNSARLGSFGEHVFEQTFSSSNLRRKHFDRADFELSDSSIDIKSKRSLSKEYINLRNYNGPKIKNISYILVDFHKDFVVISKDKKLLQKLDYEYIAREYDKWLNRKTNKRISQAKKDYSGLAAIKSRIIKFFNSKGLEARIIYRTTQELFGKESPDNLISKTLRQNSVTVYLNFNDHIIKESNLKEIIAFKDHESKTFPRLDNPKLHKEKIDISKMHIIYKFQNIKDLKTRWK